MYREETTEVELQQTTSTIKESRENIPISTTAPKKSASNPSLQSQQSQNEQSSTAESSQEIKMNSGRKQQRDKNKDILKSNNAYQSVSGKDIINNNKSASNGNTSSTTSNVNSSGVDENYNDHDGGDTDHDDPLQENGVSITRRQSMNDTSQKLLKSHSMHQRHNSTPNSSSIHITTTNTSISVSPPSPSSSDNDNNNNNNDNTNTNDNVNTSTTTSTNAAYPNGINMPPQMYEETPQISYPNMNPNAPFMHVPSQYFTTPIFPNNGQYFYDPQYRFGRPPPQIPPSAQQTFVRSNVYPYPQIPIPPMHPYHNPSPLIPHQSLPARYLNPSTTGGDSGFSSRRSSLDQVRTPDFSPQHPPRIHQQKKPKQLDKALWVGNLPDSTTHDELKEFFADENMESVFHIKKSNCAFVNYKTYEAVMEAVHKYNEIEFKGIKLVCRPRKQTPADLKLKTESLSALVSENTPPPTPSEAGSTASSSTRSRRSSLPPRQRIRQPSVASMSPASSVSSSKPSSQNRYFILKSLTQDDLDISVKSGLWATQPHNEAALNKAFKSAENVYLIFSANKSGEFYGYARMLSPISKETTETVQWTPIDEAALAASSSRLSPNQDELKLRKKFHDENEDCEDDAVPSRNWGTTFKVEWIKVQKLPFIRTRQLRNPWNANREVKISRDGTEVEPVIGERLLTEFHKPPPSSYSNMSGPLLTQPLNIDGQGVVGEGQDRTLATQNGAQIPPMMDPNFMPNAQPAFFTPPPGYWHPQHIIIPPYGAPPAPPGYVPAQQAWTTTSSKDQAVGVTRVQPAQASAGVTGSTAMAPMMSLDQQQYVEGPVPQQHPHYQSVPAAHLYKPGAGVHYQQVPPQQYYRSSEDNSHVDGHISYQQQQQENMGNDDESESHMVPSYLMEEQRQSAETSSSA